MRRKGQHGNPCQHFGDSINDIALYPQKFTKNEKPKEQTKTYGFDSSLVESCHQALPGHIRQYLNARGITDAIINDYKLGWGEFYGKQWITIPIKDIYGNFIFLKLRQNPNKGDDKITYPKGIEAQIYDWNTLKIATDKNCHLRGEFDRLLLMSKGIPAITSTHGAMTFKEEWTEKIQKIPKIYVCFDNDEAGRKGTERVAEMVKNDSNQIHIITLPKEVGESGDITDYFIKLNGEPEDLFEKYAKEYFKKINSENKKFCPMTMSEFMSKQYSPITWRVEKLIPEECLTVISAPPASCKTWTALEIALRVSRGEKVFKKLKQKRGKLYW